MNYGGSSSGGNSYGSSSGSGGYGSSNSGSQHGPSATSLAEQAANQAKAAQNAQAGAAAQAAQQATSQLAAQASQAAQQAQAIVAAKQAQTAMVNDFVFPLFLIRLTVAKFCIFWHLKDYSSGSICSVCCTSRGNIGQSSSIGVPGHLIFFFFNFCLGSIIFMFLF